MPDEPRRQRQALTEHERAAGKGKPKSRAGALSQTRCTLNDMLGKLQLFTPTCTHPINLFLLPFLTHPQHYPPGVLVNACNFYFICYPNTHCFFNENMLRHGREKKS